MLLKTGQALQNADVNVGPDITIHRRLKDQKTSSVVLRQYKRRLDDQFVLYYDLVDCAEPFGKLQEGMALPCAGRGYNIGRYWAA
jgi:hypothetical protein